LAYVSSKKMIDIHSYCYGYKDDKGLAIIQDFTAHWAIKHKPMANVWTFDLESESSQLEWRMFSYDSDIESSWVTSAYVPSEKIIDIHFYF
jgi:hypothetical protein